MIFTRVIFERLTPVHRLLLKYYLWKQKKVEFFDNDGSAKKMGWVIRLLAEGRISAIPPVGYVYNDCYGIALDNIEKFYPHLVGNHALVRDMVNIFGDRTVELSYKKELTRRLSEFYYIQLQLNSEESKSGAGERILFIPYHYKKYLSLARKSGSFHYNHHNIDISHYQSAFSRLYYFYLKAKTVFLQCSMTVFYLIKLVFREDRGPVKECKYAILINNPDYQFKFKSRPVDFLLDGQIINRENTIFILLSPAMSRDNWDEIKSKCLKVLDCSNQSKFLHGFNSREKARILQSILPCALKNVLLGLWGNNVITEANTILLATFFKWSFILSRINIKHLITLNDEAIDHIGRNILLNKRGIKTWYYAHSGSLGYIFKPITRHWLWSFLYYDNYVSWNDKIIEYYQMHPQKISHYLSIGCLWSQPIVDILEGRKVLNINNETSACSKKYKTIAFFDSSYVPNSISPLEAGVNFYRCILKLMGDFPDIRAIIKEKKPEEDVLKAYKSFGGTSTVFNEQFRPVLTELKKHPRCQVTGYKGDPSEVITSSDLTVTYAFSSSTLEALGARKKAIFFDSGCISMISIFDKIPNFVAHNYDELKKLVHYWLYEVTDREFEDFLNTYVKDEIDPYLDGKAISRFRKALGE
jgi:polysaccharide biosynthesis PFTS motif protein